jgi:murein DD-endopeptidase MepM/ murein hydrolase activator NlpD
LHDPFASWLPVTQNWQQHIDHHYLGGVDYTAASTHDQTPVPVCAAGKVVEVIAPVSVDRASEVTIRHNAHLTSTYMHLKRIDVAVGDRVREGAILGLSGGAHGDLGRGPATGPHLHWHMTLDGKRVDPQTQIARHGEEMPEYRSWSFGGHQQITPKTWTDLIVLEDDQRNVDSGPCVTSVTVYARLTDTPPGSIVKGQYVRINKGHGEDELGVAEFTSNGGETAIHASVNIELPNDGDALRFRVHFSGPENPGKIPEVKETNARVLHFTDYTTD